MEEDPPSSASTFLALSMSFFESLFTILLSDPIRPLPRLRIPSVDSVVSSGVGTGLLRGGLLGRSGLVADWFESALVGLGGGGLLGGVSFVDLRPPFESAATGSGLSALLSSFTVAAVASVLSGVAILLILLRTLASGVKLLILLGGGGLGLGVLMTTSPAPSALGLVGVPGCADEVIVASAF